jgi:hypothetical protein
MLASMQAYTFALRRSAVTDRRHTPAGRIAFPTLQTISAAEVAWRPFALLSLPDHLLRIHIVAYRKELRVPQLIAAGPFGEIDPNDRLRPYPSRPSTPALTGTPSPR